MNTPFTQYKPWMIERYGDALFRVPVQLASSCPHGRCTFCSENGSKAQQTQKQESPFDQIEEAIKFSKRRYKAQKLMLYIQAFTADLTNPVQQDVISQCLEKYQFEAISIGTRPDCLPKEALDFLQRLQNVGPASLYSESLCSSDQPSDTRSLIREACPTNISVSPNQTREVWVELGVQTANDETLKTINRGHDWECSKQAILNLAERGIHVAPHVIIGLPNEQAEPAPSNFSNSWNRTAEELAKLPISGIKIHNLHIMKGTDLAAQYAENPFPMLNHWEYAEALMDFLRRIPADIPVMRISTDTPDDQLIAPHWHLEKGQFLDYVIQQMTMREISQGDWVETGNLKFETGMEPVITDDGSITFFSEDWKEHYHTKSGARLEAEKKFVEPSGLASKLQASDLKLLDVCFGLGNNSLAALCAQSRTGFQPVCTSVAADQPQTGRMPVLHSLDITALEMDRRVVRASSEHFQTLETDPVDWKNVLKDLLQYSTFHFPHSTISLEFGDARWLIQNLADDSFDIVFHDPFSSQHCPELWTVEFFEQLHRVMKPDGVLLTYSSSQPVRGAMHEAGLFIAETVPGHQMGNGTIASTQELIILSIVGQASLYSESLCPSDESGGTRSRIREACPTINERRSIPYRDEFLCATSKAILRQRQEAVENNI